MSDNEIVRDFLVESSENLNRLDRDFVGLERDPNDKAALAGVFRTIHTIKGTCGFLGFAKLEKVAHVGENLLTRLRDGQLKMNPEMTTALLGMVDAIRQMLKEIETTGADGDVDYPELRETLTRLQTGNDAGVVPVSAGAQPLAAPVTIQPAAVQPMQFQAEQLLGETARAYAPGRKKNETGTAKAARGKIGGVLVERGQVSAEAIALALQEQEHGDQRRVGEILVAMGLARDAVPETIRVGVTLLDKVMTLVGELVLARNQLLQVASTSEDTGLLAVSQRMNLIATELQEEVMKTRPKGLRMYPLAS